MYWTFESKKLEKQRLDFSLINKGFKIWLLQIIGFMNKGVYHIKCLRKLDYLIGHVLSLIFPRFFQ